MTITIIKAIIKDYFNARIVIKSAEKVIKEKGEIRIVDYSLGIAEKYFIKQYFKQKRYTVERVNETHYKVSR